MLKDYSDTQAINLRDFGKIISHNSTIIEKAITGQLVIPNFKQFTDDITTIYNETVNIRYGSVEDYIPQLSLVDPNKYAISVCTIDGQRFNIGDYDEEYCVQSTCKPINYCLALEENGENTVHRHV